jgi:hypothetical protein
MGKFNKKPSSSLNDSDTTSSETTFSWQQLMGSFELLSVEDALKNIKQQVSFQTHSFSLLLDSIRESI